MTEQLNLLDAPTAAPPTQASTMHVAVTYANGHTSYSPPCASIGEADTIVSRVRENAARENLGVVSVVIEAAP